MIEPEIAFADLKDDMILAEAMLKHVIRYVLENAPAEMAFFNQFVDKGLIERLEHVVNSDFGHVTYTEAIKILEQHNDEFEYKVYWGCDLQTEHERYLTEKEFKRLKENDRLRVLKEKNYIEKPKNSGYKSLHLIVEVPLKEKRDIRYVKAEIQLRTLAMDFWADLDHRLCYKRECKEVSEIQNNLREYAEIISRVDGQMNRLLHRII